MTTDHRIQIEQQISRAYQEYVTACLDHQAVIAALAMAEIDALLDGFPRQRDPEHDQQHEVSGQAPA